MIKTSLFLSESYQDGWADYERSIRSDTFPVWDYIILTASNAHQAQSFQRQIDARKKYLPARTVIGIIPDEGGVRVGSGGATLSALKWIRERDGFEGKRILVIHSGGDSKRVPQYSTLGKLFSPVPHVRPDGRSSTLFDEFIIAMSAVPSRIREGMLLLSGDVLLLFNPLLIDYSGHGAAVISFKEDVETGKNHGVFLRGEDGYVRAFLHKQTVETLRAIGAVNDRNAVDIDTGAVIFGVDILSALWSLISTDDKLDAAKYAGFVNDRVRLSLYGDFQYPLATDSTLERFYQEKPEGDYSPQLRACRTAVWNALRPFCMKLLRLAPAKFIHFGTTMEILRLMCGGVEDYRELGWSRCVNCSMKAAAGYNSVISSRARVEDSSYLEVSYVHGDSRIGKYCVLSYIDIYNRTVPDGVVIHGLKQSDGSFVCRIYGVDDNPRENRLFGRELTGDLWDEGDAHILWFAKIYPEKRTVDEAVEAALQIYDRVKAGKPLEASGKSMATGFHDADSEAIIAWNNRMLELVHMNRIQTLIDNHQPASLARLDEPLTKIQREWYNNHLNKADYGDRMRLHYYVGTALRDKSEVAKAFSTLSNAILDSTLAGLQENRSARIQLDRHVVRLPLRVNWGGGWSDSRPIAMKTAERC